MPEHISKEKNLNFDNSSNKSDLGSIQKFSKSSDNLEYHQNLANSSLKVSQLQKLQDTANKNVLQRVPDDTVEENPIQLQPGYNLNDQENNPEWNKLSQDERRGLLDQFINGNITPVLATYLKREGREAELPEPEDLLGTETVKRHLNQFRAYSGGASRFDTPKNFERMKNEWGFGIKDGGGQFIATKTESLEAQSKAQEPVTDQEVAEGSKLPGLWSLTSDLGVPAESWIDKSLGGEADNPKHKMVRTDIPDPEKFDLAMVKGTEISAYKKEWLAGGKTLGGKNEAKIKVMNKDKFNSEIMWGNVKPHPVEFKETPKKSKKGSGEQTT